MIQLPECLTVFLDILDRITLYQQLMQLKNGSLNNGDQCPGGLWPVTFGQHTSARISLV